MDIAELIKHPENLDRDTLYELRSLIALYPYFQSARLLMLQNLFLLHDPTFDEELRRSAIYITDRRVIFQMIEARHYQLNVQKQPAKQQSALPQTAADKDSRTLSLIDDFLSNVKNDAKENDEKPHTVPTIADLTNDYAAFLQMQEDVTPQEESIEGEGGQDELIDSFIQANKGKQRYEMKDSDEEPTGPQETSNEHIEEIFNENIVNIYIKQGRYQQALEILKSICLNNPEKSANFASQMRLLEVVVNNNKESKQQ